MPQWNLASSPSIRDWMRLCIYDDLSETALCPVLLHLYVFSYFSRMFVIVYSYFHAYLVFILTRTALLTIPTIPYILTNMHIRSTQIRILHRHIPQDGVRQDPEV
jgi:hypothetical protein